MSSYRIKLSASKDGAIVFLNEASPDILNTKDAPSDSKIVDATKASIPLVRRGAMDYADELSESLVHMMENFAAFSPPTKPLLGQLWFQKTSSGNNLRICKNPTGTTEANTWAFIGISDVAPNTRGARINLSGDIDTNLTHSFLADANNDIAVQVNLAELLGSPDNPVDTGMTYTYPQIRVDRKGRITKITQGSSPSTGVPWASVTSQTVTADRNLNATGKIMEQGNALIPRGIITMWSGSSATIPAGWALCDGANGTPDLRGRFVYGASNAASPSMPQVGARGGSTTISGSWTTSSSGDHSHTVSISSAGAHSHSGQTGQHQLTIEQMPTHQHATNWGESRDRPYPQYGALGGTNGPRNNIGSRDTDFDNYNYLSEPVGGGLGHSHTIGSDGAHTHTGSATSGGAHTHTVTPTGDSLPPYHVLCYIMKL